MTKPFLTVSEAAQLLGSSPSTVSQAIESGRLPAIKLGETNASARIPRTALFPDEAQTRDMKVARLQRQFLTLLHAADGMNRQLAALADMQGELTAALRTLSDELAMHEVEAARDALMKAS